MPHTIVEITTAISANLDKRFQMAMDNYIARIQQRAKELVASGVDIEEVNRILLLDIENNTGEWQQLLGEIGLNIDRTIFQVSNNVSTSVAGSVSDMFQWVWEPSAEHCATCVQRNGDIKTYDDWLALGLPGQGTTICGIYCKCSLEPA